MILFSINFKGIVFSILKLKKLVKTICSLFGNDNPDTAARYEISIAIVDDQNFREINHRFLKRRTISDCLSFDLSDYNATGSPKIFELVINGQMALRQAKLRGHTAESELALYVTHGLLHQFGYDDTNPVKAGSMHRREDEILNKTGFGTVYRSIVKQ